MPSTRIEQDRNLPTALLDGNPSPLLRVNKKGLLLYANRASAPLLKKWGCKVNEALPAPWKKRITRAIKDRTSEVVEEVCGKRVYSLQMLPDRDDDFVNLFGKDVTEQKRTEETLRESELRFRSLFEYSTVGLYRSTPDGRILLANPTLVRMLGYSSSDELQARNLKKEGFTPAQPRNLFQGLIETDGEVKNREASWIRGDGSVLHVRESARAVRDESGRTLFYDGVVEDITERKSVEATLREGEALFTAIFKANPAAMAITRFSDNHLIDVNDAWVEISGYQREEAIDHTPIELNLWVDVSQRENMISMLQTRGRALCEIQLRRKNGEIYDLLMSAETIVMAAGHYLITMAQDITKRRQVEQALHALSSRQEAILSAVPDIIMEVDNHKIYTWANPAGLAFFGEDVIGNSADHYFEGEQETYQIVQPLFNGNEGTFPVESWQRRKDGKKRLLAWTCHVLKDKNLNVIGALSTARDITEQHSIEQDLRQAHEHYHTLFEESADAIFILELQGAAIEANHSALEMLGYTAEEFRELSFHDISAEEDKSGKILINLLKGESISPYERYFRRKDGSIVPVELHVSLIHDRDGNPWRIQSIARDITERKKAEEVLRESEEKFRKAFITSPDSVNINRLHDGMYVSINQGFTQVMGYTEDDAVGKTSLELQIWENPGDRQRLVEGLRKDGVVKNLEACFRRKDGGIKYGLMSAAVIELGGIPHILSITRDITERKQMEEKLKENFLLLRIAGEKAKFGGWSVDLKTNRATWSDEVVAIHEAPPGYLPSAEEGIGFYAPEWREKITQVFRDCAEKGTPYNEEMEIITTNGKRVWVQTIGEAVRDEQGRIIKVHGAFQDITERKRLDVERQTLLEIMQGVVTTGSLQELLRLIHESLAKVIYAENMFVVFHNKKTGLFEEVYSVDQYDPPMQPSALEKSITAYVFRSGNPIRMTQALFDELEQQGEVELIGTNSLSWMGVPLKTLSGTLGVIVVQNYEQVDCYSQRDLDYLTSVGAPVALAIERKQAEEALHESEEKMRSIFRVAPTGIGVVKDRVIVEVNPHICEMTGYSQNELIGQSARMLYPTQEEFDFVGREKYRQIAETGSGVMETRWQKKDGSIINILLASTPIDFNDISRGLTFTALDITEHKRAEEKIHLLNKHLEQRVEERTHELLDAQEKLVRQEKLAVLGQLAGGVGHELRNPLAVISNAVYYLTLIQPDADEKVKEYLGMINRETRNAEMIITDLLDFSRIKSMNREPVSAADLARNTLERFPAPDNIKVAVNIPVGLPKVFADPRQMQQVLGNLVVNGFQSMPEGGTLTLSALKTGSEVRIAVMDTGAGILPENMGKLFEPLFTTKPKGIGLGLAVSRKLVEANGGRIEVQSEPQKGSTFTLFLPVREETA